MRSCERTFAGTATQRVTLVLLDVFAAVTGPVAEPQVDWPNPHPRPLLQDADGDVPVSGELGLIEGARLVGDSLRCVALLHGVFLDILQWQRAGHTIHRATGKQIERRLEN